MCVCVTLFREIGWTDSSEIWHGDEESKYKNNYRARFSIFDLVLQKKWEKCQNLAKKGVFWNLLKNGSNDFDEILICCSPDDYTTSEKKRMSGKNLVRTIWCPKSVRKIPLVSSHFST